MCLDNEHLILHKIVNLEILSLGLDFIAIADGRIVTENIVYTHSKIVKDNGKEEGVITFGPLSVLPEFQNKGIGGLLNHSIVKAREIGYKAILIYGYPDYYKRFGFIGAVKFVSRE